MTVPSPDDGLEKFEDNSGVIIVVLLVVVCLVWFFFILRACCGPRMETSVLGARDPPPDADALCESLNRGKLYPQ